MRTFQQLKYSLGLRLMSIPRLLYHRYRSSQIRNKQLSLFCNNCFGAQVLHDMGMRFNSPCVNLAFDFKDYIDFLSDLRKYLQLDIIEVPETGLPYPVGRFEGTETLVKFMHYTSFEEAYSKWMSRRSRIIWDNIFILLEIKELPPPTLSVSTDSQVLITNEELIQRFLALPYKKAIISKPHSAFISRMGSVYHEVPYFEDFCWGKALSWASAFSLKRNTDYFDYVSFFNDESTCK